MHPIAIQPSNAPAESPQPMGTRTVSAPGKGLEAGSDHVLGEGDVLPEPANRIEQVPEHVPGFLPGQLAEWCQGLAPTPSLVVECPHPPKQKYIQVACNWKLEYIASADFTLFPGRCKSKPLLATSRPAVFRPTQHVLQQSLKGLSESIQA
jgi:hypothetical protein